MELGEAKADRAAEFANARSETIRRRARGLVLVICGLWVPAGLFIDPMMFGGPLRGLWLRLPTAGGLLLLRYWLRRPRPRVQLETVVSLAFCLVLAAFGPVVAVCTRDNILPNLLSILIGAMAMTAGLALSWPSTALVCGVANVAMLMGGIARPVRPDPVFFLLAALGFVLYPFMIFAAASRDRWQRAEWQAREDLRKAYDQLRREERARAELFVNLSHDLRTPLSVVRTEVELLRARTWQADPKCAEGPVDPALDRIEANVGSVVDLLDQLLELARLDAKRTPCAPERCELVSAARQVAAQLQPGRDGVRIAIRSDLGAVHAGVDRSHLRRILVNLVSNALRHIAQPNGEVEILIAEGPSGPRIEVSDNGPGIAPELRARLFERFAAFSREGSTSSGIGLALARELARLNEGALDLVDSAAPTTFRLQLAPWASGGVAEPSYRAEPARQAEAAAFPRPEPPLDLIAPVVIGHGDSLRPAVLLVEDNEDLRAAMVRALSGRFAIEPVGSLTAALASLARRTPAAIVADVMFPDGDGYDLLEAVRQGPRLDRIPFLLVSALAEPSQRVRGLQAGADDYLTKPFSNDELRARIAAAIARADERVAGVAREREDLLMELHDGVCSTLARTVVILSSRSDSDSLDRRAQSAVESVQKGLGEARSLLDALGASTQPWGAVVASLRWQLAEAAGRTGVVLDLTLEGDAIEAALDVPPGVAHALRRIAAEALTNTVRHASASRFELRLQTRDRTIYLHAQDDGRGTPEPLVEGHGLSIIRRRAARCGGGVRIARAEWGGVVLDAWLPLDARATARTEPPDLVPARA